MASIRNLAVAVAGLVVAGCNSPTPDYKLVRVPPPYRIEQNGQRLDNEDYAMDAQGFRVDKQGNRLGTIDIPGKTAGEQSNAMAGFYISSIGRNAPGNVMVPSEGGSAGPGYGPGSANPAPSGSMPAPSTIISPGPSTSLPSTPPSSTVSTTPVPSSSVLPPTPPSTTGPAATGTPTPITPTPSK